MSSHIQMLLFIVLLLLSDIPEHAQAQKSDIRERMQRKVVVSENKRFLQYEDGEPFFWLGDTGWLLFEKLTREEACRYLENRKKKGFNVIQCMVVPTLPLVNVYRDSAFIENDISRPKVTEGNDYTDTRQYDFWDHVEFILDEAAKNGIRLALVPLWGSVAKRPAMSVEKVAAYITHLTQRFGSKPNIFWLNGGDIRGDFRPEIWKTIGSMLRSTDGNHLVTYHPFGRTQSSQWFHNEPWLDFNMFQSGHRRYDQVGKDDVRNWKGEDNWRYVLEDYAKQPPKPTLDGEPSYENIPQGLHDTTQPYWGAGDCRRYAYWSVFAGSCGHTYGDNAVMQMHKPGDQTRAYGAREYWFEAIDDPGSFQMQHLARLMLSRPYFERVYDSALVVDQSRGYDFIPATRGDSYLFAYTYTGRAFAIALGRISGKTIRACWYDPRAGTSLEIGIFENVGTRRFQPPGKPQNGNAWVLILDDVSKKFRLF
ncbi:MAG: glycoside hydrolase family 140 protein [bacterium]